MINNVYYLSQLLGKPVFDPVGHPLGRLVDLVVRVDGSFPPVTGLTMRVGSPTKKGQPLVPFLHWRQVASVSMEGIGLSSTLLDLQTFRRRPRELLLDNDLFDQQVIDLDGRRLVRVNDVQLVASGQGGSDLRLAGIDIGVRGLLRRLGIDRLIDWLTGHTPIQVPDHVMPWEDIEPIDLSDLPEDQGFEEAATAMLGRKGGLQLTHERLAVLHPADVAELVAGLAAPERAAIIESLDADVAAEALGEMDPEMQADVLEDLPTDAATDILAELPPDEAADVVAEMSPERATELMGGLDAAEAQAVFDLMSYPEGVAGAIMNSSYVAVSEHMTAQQTIEALRELAPPAEEVYYVYTIDEAGRLVGVLPLRDLIVAQPSEALFEISQTHGEVVQVRADLDLEEVIRIINKYNLLALPVTDDQDRLVGVITVDDALATVVPSEAKRRIPHVWG